MASIPGASRQTAKSAVRSSVAVLLFLGSSAVCAADRDPDLGIGRDATQAEIAAWDSDVRPDGSGLPDGRGSVEQGEAVFQQSCSACHTTTSRAALAPALVGGVGSLATAKPLQTVGSYWPYATTLFDYVRRAMPFNAPHSLTNDQVYAVSAYILHLNGIVPADAIMDQHSLPQIRMPNRDGFHSVWHDAP
jgi:mono/diheme cytochrome c family protein